MTASRPNYTKMSKERRCELVESIFIKHPRFNSIVNKVEHAHSYSQIAAEPECVFVGGLPGAGKTTLVEYYEQLFPRIYHDDKIEVPVLCGRVPNRATDKSLVTELLNKMGDPAAAKGSTYNQTTRLRNLAGACGVKLIILDEFQHFVDKDSWKILKTVSDWLKNLIDEAGVPIVVTGMPYASQILDAMGNEQLQRRFSVRASLDPFGWSAVEEKKEFRSFLKAVDDRLPLRECSFLSDPTTAFRFYCATNGRVGKVMKVIRRATELALAEGSERLTLDVLADAYDDRLRADHPNRSNSFREEKAKLKIIPFDEPELNFGLMNRRSRRGKRVERTSDVLTQ